MDRKKIIYLVGIVFLICFSVIFSAENYNEFVLGDYIFSKMGIAAWSNGYEGLHYTVFVTFIFLIIGMLELGRVKRELKVSTSKLIIVFLVISFLYQPAFRFSYDKIKEISGGLKAIEYLRKDSRLLIIEKDGNRSADGNFKFFNHSKNEKRFFVEILRSNKEKKENPYFDIFKNSIIFSEVENEVIISPKSETVVHLKKDISSNNKYPAYCESSGFDIRIFDKENQVEFIENKY